MTKLIVALDVEKLEKALEFVDAAGPEVEWYKIGSQLFCEAGPEAVAALKRRGKKVFLDLKFHDIPNTVANAVAAGVRMGADMVNVHASGGSVMMRAAVEAAKEAASAEGTETPLVIAVTVLTSMDASALGEVINAADDDANPAEHVRRLAQLAENSGMDGVVCSAMEIELIKGACGSDFTLVVPGIRPAGSALGDQKRVMTPAEAAAKEADFIVVGRPVLKAENPAAAAKSINAELCQ
ncbi:MAG: orotidine-5'-phosphate decarboxylase [Victivallales bacterium]|nr:orotidine-5'-phosphate decarboxylase [Victivallales bacterium]